MNHTLYIYIYIYIYIYNSEGCHRNLNICIKLSIDAFIIIDEYIYNNREISKLGNN